MVISLPAYLHLKEDTSDIELGRIGFAGVNNILDGVDLILVGASLHLEDCERHRQ